MQSKFNILILEDDKRHRKELKGIFEKESLGKYNIFLSTTIDEFQEALSKRYYLGMSLDHKVPLNDKEGAKKYDIDIINKLYQYHPLGYKSIYTAFPEWDSAKTFGAKIDYASKKELSTEEWVGEMYNTLKEYKVFTPTNQDIYNDAIKELFFPFGVLINRIMQNPDTSKYYQQLFSFSIEMFWVIFCAIQDEDETLNAIVALSEKLDYMKKNILEQDDFLKQELSKVLEIDFLEDMIAFNRILTEDKCNFFNDENCEDYIALLVLKLNFFASHHFALKLKVSRNYLRQKEIEIEKIENRAFITKEYITYFEALPKNVKSLHLVLQDYEGKSYFLDLERFISIDFEEMNANLKVSSKIEDKQLFPLEE